MMSLLIRWIVNALCLLAVTWLTAGRIGADSTLSLFIAALVLGFLNAVVKPILFWLTLPITIITLGIFLIVLNGLMLELTSMLVPGFHVVSFLWAMIGGIVLGILALLTNGIGKKEE